MNRRLLSALAIVFATTLAFGTVACSSKTQNSAKDTLNSAKKDAAKKTDEVAARAAAEGLRVSLKGNDTAGKEGIRSVKAINQAAKDLPGNAKFSGVKDSDGDGMDDDGKVEVTVGSGQACLTLPKTGENTTVKGGAC